MMWVVLAALSAVGAALVANILWRHQLEATLREGEARFRAAFETAAHGMALVSIEGCFLKVNEAFCAMLGYPEDALVGTDFRSITFPEDIVKSCASVERFLAGDHRPCHFEKRYLHKSGRLVWAELSTTLVRDPRGRPLYFVSQIQDISERKQTEEALEATRRQLENIIEFLPDATFAIDINGHVVAWNRAMEKLSGVSSEAVLGQGDYLYRELLTGQRDPLLIDLVTAADEESAGRYEILEKRGDTLFAERFLPRLHNGRGGYFWIKASPLFDYEGRLIGAIESLRDITQRREAEEDLQRANRDLDAFVATVAHDLRTPLTPILGFAQYLQAEYAGELKPEVMDLLGRIENQGQRMLDRMETLLELARVGYLERPQSAVRGDLVLGRVKEHLADQLLAHGTTLSVTSLPGVRIPEPLLVQLFENLCGNALKYAGQAGVAVGGAPYARGVRFFVRDQGPGIPVEERERVFDVFYRGSTAGATSGTGIGLATVKKIVRLYGGHVWIEETPGGGTTFWVEFPDDADRSDVPGEPAPEPEAVGYAVNAN